MANDNNSILATFKILIVGESSVGKSSLLLRYIRDEFNEHAQLTIGVDFQRKTLNIDSNIVNLALWDTAGQERFRALTPSFYKGAHAVVLVYDVTNRESLQQLNMWMKEVDTYSTRNGIVKMVIGNKTDLVDQRAISTEEGKDFAARVHAMFLEVSAKSNDGVTVAFEEIAQKIIQTPGLWEATEGSVINLSATDTQQQWIPWIKSSVAPYMLRGYNFFSCGS